MSFLKQMTHSNILRLVSESILGLCYVYLSQKERKKNKWNICRESNSLHLASLYVPTGQKSVSWAPRVKSTLTQPWFNVTTWNQRWVSVDSTLCACCEETTDGRDKPFSLKNLQFEICKNPMTTLLKMLHDVWLSVFFQYFLVYKYHKSLQDIV